VFRKERTQKDAASIRAKKKNHVRINFLEIFRRVYLNHQEVYESLDEESN
jgi:hypothetical protein